MTKEELIGFVKMAHAKGYSNDDLAKMLVKMFQDGKCIREQFEALLDALGLELSGDLKNLNDDELKKTLLK